MNARLFIITIFLALACGVGGFYIGEKKGIKKGAKAGSGLAVLSSENYFGFVHLLEKSMHEGNPPEEMMRDLMIDALEGYQSIRTMLSVEPYGHEYKPSVFTHDQQVIERAVARLKKSEALFVYRADQDGGINSVPLRSTP